ncbi:acidic leucine-rich nuclear phosphoprotein 32 family member B-like [Chenopodium quinoa]|uniref:acidic leucine-rich nuclear phosphoprotein 32 family member B-like n=1 Tax=Chenopodium quinoa TaxID=63459 RepID=UPI000B77AA44|nr:acidic leucine-rich nuclear phosphoprotein 32 family member B-like [Chenopodium quinoa]
MASGSQITATSTPFNPSSWKPDPTKNSAENLASFDAYFVFLMADINSYRVNLEPNAKSNVVLSDSEEEVDQMNGEEEEDDDDEADKDNGDDDSQEGRDQDNQGDNQEEEVDSGDYDTGSANSIGNQYWGGRYL